MPKKYQRKTKAVAGDHQQKETALRSWEQNAQIIVAPGQIKSLSARKCLTEETYLKSVKLDIQKVDSPIKQKCGNHQESDLKSCDQDVDNTLIKRKRGRPRSYQISDQDVDYIPIKQPKQEADLKFSHQDVNDKRRRGRPRSYQISDVECSDQDVDYIPIKQPKQEADLKFSHQDVNNKRKRGRPRGSTKSRPNQEADLKFSHQDGNNKRKRGRPRGSTSNRPKQEADLRFSHQDVYNISNLMKRKRGRPRIYSPSKKHFLKSLGLNGNLENKLLTARIEAGENSTHLDILRTSQPSHLEPLATTDQPEVVISKFCKQMYDLGWATGTGGGMSVKHNNIIYMAPSGVQKEMIQPQDVYQCNEDGAIICSPNPNLKLTECAPLFMNAYRLRNAGAVIHSHGIYAVLATLLFKGDEFRISHMEMLKGIKKGSSNNSFGSTDTLVVPIIENTSFENELADPMKEAMKKYPESNAVLVRSHGVYVWGDTWQRAKSQAECYHYLFETAVKMRQMGIKGDDPPNEAQSENK